MKIKIWSHFKTVTALFIFLLLGFLQGCASSDVARGAAGEADQAYLQTDYTLRHPGAGPSSTYQNSSQMAKGVVFGGAIGAAAGSATSLGALPGLGMGAIIGGAIGKYIDSHTTLMDKLENRHVQVIALGDQLMLVLPSSLIFNSNSSNISAGAYDTLDTVAEFISSVPNMSVKVTAYTSAAVPESVARSLSQQQATNIVKYLWQRNVNTRLIYAEGGGGTKLVTANIADWASDNYRIEITFEKLPT